MSDDSKNNKQSETVASGINNPWTILGVDLNADDRQVRAAYLQKVKAFPPDRAPEQFERVRDAYEQLRDPRRRGRSMILSADPQADLVSLLENSGDQRCFVGPDLWLAALEKK